MHLQHHPDVGLVCLYLRLFDHFVQLPTLLQLTTDPERVYQRSVSRQIRLDPSFGHLLQYLHRHLRVLLLPIDLHQRSIKILAIPEPYIS